MYVNDKLLIKKEINIMSESLPLSFEEGIKG
jgi:hypothetical protein